MTHWICFAAVFFALIAVDLWLAEERPSLLSSALKTGLNIAVALCFGVYVWQMRGETAGMEFVAGYTLEMSLSFDNVFMISLVMTAMAVPYAQRARMLLLGILGAILLRGVFIATGAALVDQFRWLLLAFAAFLIWTGGKMIYEFLTSDGDEETVDVENSRTLRLLRRWLPVTPDYVGGRFFHSGMVTPLLLALAMVEVIDLLFAVDSIPAIFAITTDPFVVFTSNMFAVASLRSLFFVLEAMVHRFEKLPVALSAVLVFIGAKVIAAEAFGEHIPTAIALGGVLGILAAGIAWSLASTKARPKAEAV